MARKSPDPRVNAYADVPYEEKFLSLVRVFSSPDGETPLQLTYNETEAAKILFGGSKIMLMKLRHAGNGPKFITLNGRIRYRLFDLVEWAYTQPAYRNTDEALDHGVI